MEELTLKVEDISKAYGTHLALSDINISIKPGEVHAVIGENGAGKSTLMKIIAGLERKSSGQLFMCGQQVNIETPTQAQMLGINIILQDIKLVPSLSVQENIFMGRWIKRGKLLPIIDVKKQAEKAKELLKQLKFDIKLNEQVSKLGLGQQKMVEIVRALCWDSKLLILDEVTACLTDYETENVFNMINRCKDMGISVFFISHKIDEVFKIADKITILRDGKLAYTYDKENFNVRTAVMNMSGEDFVNRYPKIKQKIGKEVLRLCNIWDGVFLKDFNLSIKEGEILGLTGMVGSGRSSVAKAIFGINPITSGKILINNKEVAIKSPTDAINQKIGYIAENRFDGLVHNFRMPENMTLSTLKSVSNNSIIDKHLEKNIALDYAKRFVINNGNISQKVENMSGGNQQKVMIAKWLLSSSKVFIMDEPTKGLDIASKVELYNLMNKVVLKGASILLISSDLNEIIGMSDRTLVIYKGEVAKELVGKDITESNIMYYASGGT